MSYNVNNIEGPPKNWTKEWGKDTINTFFSSPVSACPREPSLICESKYFFISYPIKESLIISEGGI